MSISYPFRLKLKEIIKLLKTKERMTNLDIIGKENIKIPNEFREIETENLVKKDDRIAMVSIPDLQNKKFDVTWIKPDENEIGKIKKFSGQLVIRKR